MDEIEDEISQSPLAGTAREVHHLSRSLFELRRALWPTRDAINTLIREPLPVLSDNTRVYLRDCADHTARAIDLIETYRELGSNLMALYQSMVSNRMNEVMKVLTIIATIFIPLSFVAGVYGMNFDPEASRWNMPELTWTWGYPVVLSLMVVIALGMLLFFKRRGWLGSPSLPANGTPRHLRRHLSHGPSRLHHGGREEPGCLDSNGCDSCRCHIEDRARNTKRER